MGDCVRKDESKSKKQRAWKISHIQAFPKYSGAFLNTYKEMLELTFSDWSFTTHPDINKTKPFELVAIQAASKAHDSSPGQIFNCRKSVQLHYFPRHCASAATDWRAALLFLGGDEVWTEDCDKVVEFCYVGFVCLGFFEDGKDICLKNKTCTQANRQHCSVEICSPVAHCEEIQEN